MKFSTPGGVAKICGNQTETRSCFINALWKVAKHEEISSTVTMVQTELMDVEPEKAEEDMILDEGLDPQILSPESSASHAEELEAFSANPSDSTQMLQVGQKLEEGINEELK
ncbi:Uncharacterized protein Adt_35554 [Abeliophyllum distichum]|uniref:Uncharacterized protein n=1 Tax=Abeliophyllum distichum TaxID=126358 RepID=A0ABD1QGX1_9LAMI